VTFQVRGHEKLIERGLADVVGGFVGVGVGMINTLGLFDNVAGF
jgi:hypothetical protein